MINTAIFMRKACNLKELKHLTAKYPHQTAHFIITKYIELNDDEFKDFCNDFFEDRKFIVENEIHMHFGDDKYYCLLIYNKNSNDGILVESEGYSYARYTAVVDMSKMNEVSNG